MRSYLFPYPILTRDLELTIKHIRLDRSIEKKLHQDDLSDQAKDDRTRQVFLWSEDRQDWESISVSLQVEIPREEFSRLEEIGSEVDAVIVATCARSNFRQTWQLKRISEEGYRWSGVAKLDKELFYGTVLLQCILTGEALSRQSRYFAESPFWKFYFDEAQSPPIHGAIPIEWVNFQEDKDLPFLRRYANDTNYLAIEDASPKLYLNSGFEGLQELFNETPKPTGYRLGLFESVSVSIAKSVWLALFQTAATGISGGEGESDYEWPDVQWQKDVLEQLLPHIYPNQNEEGALQEAGEAITSGIVNFLESEALAVINQTIINEGKAVRKAIHQLERED